MDQVAADWPPYVRPTELARAVGYLVWGEAASSL